MIKLEKYHKREAKDLIDLLFNRNFLNPELTRESINWLEGYIGFLFQSKAQIAAKTATFIARIKEKK